MGQSPKGQWRREQILAATIRLVARNATGPQSLSALRTELARTRQQGYSEEHGEVTPIGRYAVRIRFDDGHDTGLYSWDALYDLGRDQPAKWGKYLADLQKHGLSR